MTQSPTLKSLRDDLAAGRVTARALVEACLARINDPAGQGRVVFVEVDGDAALTAADRVDAARARGEAVPAFAGVPVSVKDLFDVTGQVTRAGSMVLEGPPAAADAPAVAALRGAGFIIIGRTNMTEFAYSGLGLNPHYGTPLSTWREGGERIAGGSSSGAAASVAAGMAHAGLGTDTGGSVRIPAAFNGLTGFKPTASRVSQAGVIPLARSLDAVGVIARSVACCRSLDAILAGEAERDAAPPALPGLRLLAPVNVVRDGLDPTVVAAFASALDLLRGAGAEIVEAPVASLDAAKALGGRGLAPAEAYAWHRELIAREGPRYDPRVLSRLMGGAKITRAELESMHADRTLLIADFAREAAGFNALVLPTVAVVPPRLTELESDEDYLRINALVLRNTALINMLDGCAISLPITAKDDAPVGLMLAAPGGADRVLLDAAEAVERALAR